MSSPRKINILVSAYACEPYKGSEQFVGWNWVINLAQKYNVFVLTRRNNKEVIDKFLEENSRNNIKFFYYDCSKFWLIIKRKVPYGNFLYFERWQKGILHIAKKVVDKNKIDIIHHITFNGFRNPGYLHMLDYPFVWGPIGGGQQYNVILRQAYYKTTDILLERIRNRINLYKSNSRNVKSAMDNAEVILVADKSTDRLLAKTNKKLRLLETAYYYKEQEHSYNKHERIQLLWVGNIIPRKGLKLLIDALGESDFRLFELTIVGDGSDRLNNEKQVCKYQIENYVNFVGQIDYTNIGEFYKNADLFIFTSLRDTSGNVVLEAMAHGIPVVALNDHGVADIVTEQTGNLIEITSYDQIKKDLAAVIKEYYFNQQLIQLKGSNARLRIKDYYSWDKKMLEIEKVYEKALMKYKK